MSPREHVSVPGDSMSQTRAAPSTGGETERQESRVTIASRQTSIFVSFKPGVCFFGVT